MGNVEQETRLQTLRQRAESARNRAGMWAGLLVLDGLGLTASINTDSKVISLLTASGVILSAGNLTARTLESVQLGQEVASLSALQPETEVPPQPEVST